ncbi:hypothetical protein UPYG_G00226180 [Umbra pygmaea]|uniref:Doublecortin domain-containing protein n=1 Tax=Umbra pygmaea TaxID=75934 RepID=A0ABD0WUT0_UMBPY
MHSDPAGLCDPHGPQSKDVAVNPLHPPSSSRLSHATAAPLAKRITFYKSGDTQFAGVKMAIHKRSFKCFDALLDDLSQKVPLSFGVRTVTTPRGIHNIKHLDQLEDGGCYLCSDRRQAKPINLELAGKRPAVWHHNSRRVQQRSVEAPTPPSAQSQTPTRQRRILLVRNSDPSVRRSVILRRRSARSLRAFLEDISELMQCHIRKLYTLEGRKIDSVQSLMTCPGVLVCVGREAFRPLLLECINKSSEEKLPGLGTRSPGNGARSPGNGARSPSNGQGACPRSSVCSEGPESKRNVNFGLKTKKSIIHPRSDSSNRSTRFSLSSEKSYSNGLSTFPHSQSGRDAVPNDDIEKRVLVNKDGSLSVEMRVRFRLHSDETLQWSTEIKKSPPDSLTNGSCPLREAPPRYLQQAQSESCSDPDSAPMPPQCSLEEPLPHCASCYQKQAREYDIWEIPAHIQTSKHSNSRVRHTHSSSSSSSCHSRSVVRRRAVHRDGSESGKFVQECCIQEEVQRRVELERNGGRVEVCKVSRSCSRSELNLSVTDHQGEERPLSNSSHVLQALQEDVDDLPPSASSCCYRNTPQQPLALTSRPLSHLSTSSSRKRTSASTKQGEEGREGKEGKGDIVEERVSRASNRCSVYSCSCCGGDAASQADRDRAASQVSHRSRSSQRSRSPSNRIWVPLAPEEADDEDEEEERERAASVLSTHTGLSCGSGGSIGSIGSTGSNVCPQCGEREQSSSPTSGVSLRSHCSKRSMGEEERLERGLSDGSDESGCSQRTNRSNCTNYYQEGRAATGMSRLSLPREGEETAKEGDEEVGEKRQEGEKEDRAASALSAKSSPVRGRTFSNSQECNASESQTDLNGQVEGGGKERGEERAASVMSAKSNISAKSSRSHMSTCSKKQRAPSSKMPEAPVTEDDADEVEEARAASTVSANSNLSGEFSGSHQSTCSKKRKKVSSCSPKPEATDRPTSALSVKSNILAKSGQSQKSTCSKADGSTKASERAASLKIEPEAPENIEKAEPGGRSASAMSAKTNTSSSNGSQRSNCSHRVRADFAASSETNETHAIMKTVEVGGAEGEKMLERAESSVSLNLPGTNARSAKFIHLPKTPVTKDAVYEVKEQRPASAQSNISNLSTKSSRCHKSTCSTGFRAVSPNPAACETPVSDKAKPLERAVSTMSTKTNTSTKSNKSNTSHKSTGCRAEQAAAPNSAEAPAIGLELAGDGELTEGATSAMSARTRSSAKSSRCHRCGCTSSTSDVFPKPATCEGPVNDPVEIERTASSMSAKTCTPVQASRSDKCTSSTHARAETPGAKDILGITTTGSDEANDDSPATDTEERPVSAISTKTTASLKSNRSHKCTCRKKAESTCSKPANLPVIETTRDKVTRENERPNSVMSATSKTSAKSVKSPKSTCSESARAISPVAQYIPVIDTTGGNEDGEQQEEATERPASAMPAKSTASSKSSKSQKSTSCKRAETKVADLAIIEITEGEEKSDDRPATAMSAKSNTSAGMSICNGVQRDVSPANVPVIETTQVYMEGETVKRTASAMSAKSQSRTSETSNGSNRIMFPHVKKQKGVSPVCMTGGDEVETVSVKSSESTKPKSKADSLITRPLSRASQASAKSTREKSDTTETANEEDRSQVASHPTKDNVHGEEASSVNSKRSTIASPGDSRPVSVASACSSRSDGKIQKVSKNQELKAKTGASDFLQVNGQGHRVRPQGDTNSVHSVKSSKTEKTVIEGKSSLKSCQMADHLSQPTSLPEGSKATVEFETTDIIESIFSQSLSAADLHRGNMAASCPSSASRSKVSLSESGKNQKSRRPRQEKEALEKLDPLCLPNTSPNDVVSNWLLGIPAVSSIENTEDEINQKDEETRIKEGKSEEKRVEEWEAERTEGKSGDPDKLGGEGTEEKQEPVKSTEQDNMTETRQEEVEAEVQEEVEVQEEQEIQEEQEVHETTEQPEEEQETAVEDEIIGEDEKDGEEEGEGSKCCPEPVLLTSDITSCRPSQLSLSRESELPRSCHSSVTVMKVLLSPTIGRCRSLPEISPVYGRRLSSSARGLLDCLAQLQLIDPPPLPAAAPSPDRDQRYQEVMDILGSLWLSKPLSEEGKADEGQGEEGKGEAKERLKDSGVDLSSGSAGSGGSGKSRPDDVRVGDFTPIAEGEAEGGEGVTEGGEGLTEGGEEATEGGKGQAEGGTEAVDTERGGKSASAELLSDAATPDITCRVCSNPANDVTIPECLLQNLESLNATGSPCFSDSTAYRSPTDTERSTTEDNTSSGTPPSVQRAPLSKRVSQDPDPIWVLNLLKKLEKQFMAHYIDAMAEFKVRWDLDDSAMLDAMITDLRDEVRMRIQKSIDRELRKIQSRAGRGSKPRPPMISRDSSATNQRRRRLKVMKVQSVNQSDVEQGSGADVSDQRSEGEDEHCPCDACIRKKAEAQQLKREAMVTTAPVMLAFDLRKILMMKKDPEVLAPLCPTDGKNKNSLENEEKKQDFTKEDIIPTVVIEETIPEGDEDKERKEVGEVVEETEEEEAGGDIGGEIAGENYIEGEDAGEVEETGLEETPDEDVSTEAGAERGEREVQEGAAEEFKPHREKGEATGKREIPLIHQITRTSVESQTGSLENTDPVSTMRSLTPIDRKETVSDGHKMASAGEGSGGKGQRRSRSPARTKRRIPKECDIEPDELYM